jgi:hypothetical protein
LAVQGLPQLTQEHEELRTFWMSPFSKCGKFKNYSLKYYDFFIIVVLYTPSMIGTRATVLGHAERVEHEGYKLYIDGFFSSPPLFADLHTNKGQAWGVGNGFSSFYY